MRNPTRSVFMERTGFHLSTFFKYTCIPHIKAVQLLCVYEGVGNNQITDLIKRLQTDYWIILSTSIQFQHHVTGPEKCHKSLSDVGQHLLTRNFNLETTMFE